MKTLIVLLRCTIYCALGSSIGVVLIAAGQIEQGVGLAIIGGSLGFVLAISSVLYKTSSAETFWRGVLIFLKLTLAKNIPGDDKLVQVEDKDLEGRHGRSADPVTLDDRMYLGMRVGCVLAVVPAILIATYIQNANGAPAPMIIEILKRILIGFGIVAIVGGGCGAAVGSLTVSGVHRRNIAIGTIVGGIIGAGLATAIFPGALIPAWQLYAVMCGGFGFLGMAAGLISGDNFRSGTADVSNDVDETPDP